jgi:hypothetical protein
VNRTHWLRLSFLLGVPALALVAASDARAGDRKLGLRFVNMTPDAASSEASTKCVATLRDRAAKDGAELRPITETPLRKLIKAEDRSVGFMTWTSAATKPAYGDVDSFFAVDCRPEQQRLDALLVNKSGARVEFRLRGESLDRARAVWVMDEVLRHAWAGFEL